MNSFDKILLKYGPFVFYECFKVAKQAERYEDCAEMKRVAGKYNVSLDTSSEDWQTEFWRLGMIGETALDNAPAYLVQALQEIGYTACPCERIIKANLV